MDFDLVENAAVDQHAADYTSKDASTGTTRATTRRRSSTSTTFGRQTQTPTRSRCPAETSRSSSRAVSSNAIPNLLSPPTRPVA